MLCVRVAVPTLASLAPTAGPASGGDLVRLFGASFAPRLMVRFGERPAVVLGSREDAGRSIADVRAPAHDSVLVDVVVQNLDEDHLPIPGELAVLAGAYRFLRPAVARESDLTRAVRQLLRELKRQVLANVSATVSVDYDDNVVDGQSLIAMAKVPSLVLSGPTQIGRAHV